MQLADGAVGIATQGHEPAEQSRWGSVEVVEVCTPEHQPQSLSKEQQPEAEGTILLSRVEAAKIQGLAATWWTASTSLCLQTKGLVPQRSD